MGTRQITPLIVIVGPTASGKTSLAVDLAAKHGGEIICADSRTIYKSMDIGTAKPTQEQRTRVPHWGLDLVEPGERFTAADFKNYALEKIAEIRNRGNVPFLVGGTGLYVDAVVFDYQFGEESTDTSRRTLELLSVEELLDRCNKYNIPLPENYKNKRYLIRAIEQKRINTKRRASPERPSIIVGIATNRQIIRTRIADRSEQILTNAVVEEAILLGKKYGWDSEAMTGNIYPLLNSYLKKELTLEEVRNIFTTLDWQLAKRQMTWFRRNPYIIWLSQDDVEAYVSDALAT